MNLTELQIQLRSIEEHISDLQAKIEKMKPHPEDEKKVMFEKITEMASKYPLENRRFPTTSNIDVKTYISCLAYISLADDSNIYDKLLFLCRLSHGMGLPMSSEDVFRMGLEIDEKYFDKNCSELKSQKYSFLADALILANITEEATEASFRLIADIAKIFECEKEELRVAAMVAKAVLIEDFNILKQIPVPSKKRWMGQLREHIPLSWIESQRVKCGEVCTEQYVNLYAAQTAMLRRMGITHNLYPVKCERKNPCIIKKRLNTGMVVKKGEVLLLYEEKVNNYETMVEKESLTAPCDGVVFFIESNKKSGVSGHMDKFLEVYVVSYFDNYDEFCDWHKKK